MSHIEMWRFVTDMALMLSLGYLCFRFLRAPVSEARLERLAQLENTLRSLVQEAEVASRTLNDHLLRRQQTLEKTLFDIETIEERVNKVIDRASEKHDELRELLSQGTSSRPDPYIHRPEPTAIERVDSFKPTSYQPLESQIELARNEQRHHPLRRPAVEHPPVVESVQEVYERAVDTIEEAQSITAAVARQLHEPAPVRSKNEPSEPRDPRLGVLGEIKRQVQVL